MLLVAFALAAFTQRENQRLRVPWLNVGAKTSHVIHTFRSLALRPSHGSSILLLLKENLFQNKWNAFFIASLVWNDHSLRIWVENVNELTPQQQANVDYIISISEFEADVIRSPKFQSRTKRSVRDFKKLIALAREQFTLSPSFYGAYQ